MKLILTRPEADAKLLAAKLETMGHTPLLAPLLKIVPRTPASIPDRRWQAICLTSANAVGSISAFPALKTKRMITVGPQSHSAAQAAGFTHVESHGGNVAGLVEHLRKNLTPAAGPILYPSGAETSGDLEGQLRSHGFDVERIVVYDAKPVTPANLQTHVAEADGVLLYSPRTALLWNNLNVTAGKLMHFCLSAAVAAKLPHDMPRKIAPAPDEDGMLELLRTEALNSKAKQNS
jgi:uroporphyrinogen-III synthase